MPEQHAFWALARYYIYSYSRLPIKRQSLKTHKLH